MTLQNSKITFLVILAVLVESVRGVVTATYTNLPYQAYTGNDARGPQTGYNICNSTTQGSSSFCQTLLINGIDDFCLWGSPNANSLLANVQSEVVAYCTKDTHGARIIPDGALTGVQYIKTPDYVQVTGLIVQIGVGLTLNDTGGQLDPHGTDGFGNPLGGLVFTNAFAASGNDANTFIQAVEWNSIMGGDTFCLKACDPSSSNAAQLCNYQYHRIGCSYNAPAAYAFNVFESCLGDSQDPVGVYTGTNGVFSTYTEPPDSVTITSPPYTPRIPASSQCTTFSSAQLFATSTGDGFDIETIRIFVPIAVVGTLMVAILGFIAVSLVGHWIKGWIRKWRSKEARHEVTADPELELSTQSAEAPWAIPPTPPPKDETPIVPSIPLPSTSAPASHSNPPEYRSFNSGSRSMSQAMLMEGIDGISYYNDEIGRWANDNREMISSELEQKLRDAHYRPSDDPNEIPAQEWRDAHGIGHFELKRLQELYARRIRG